jgi:cyclic di-GMP phosphodiesterase
VNNQTNRILVVDDDPASQELLAELLLSRSYDVITAGDGVEALEAFEREEPALVLLDVMMPRLDGFETCRRLKSSPQGRLTPVILVTALSASEDRIRGLDVGADGFITKPVDRAMLLAQVRALLRLKQATDELERAEVVLLALARSIEGKDPYTRGHCERLSQYSAELGRRLGLSEEEITALRRAGTVHDIGKVAVPDSILLKPGPLTPEEWKIMREHPVVGERICSPLKSFRKVLPIIRHHHEKLNGSGYPDGLRGDEIPLTARVLQAVDVYDALTTVRPYKPALSPEEALRVLQEETDRGWWDRCVVEEFCQIVTGGGTS